MPQIDLAIINLTVFSVFFIFSLSFLLSIMFKKASTNKAFFFFFLNTRKLNTVSKASLKKYFQ